MIFYKKSLLRIGEVWFDIEEAANQPVDVICYRDSKQPMSGAVCKPFYTSCLDLHKEIDLLFAGMKKETRYEIRRAAEKDSLVYKYWTNPNKEALAQFVEFYDAFAAQKGLRPMDCTRLMQFANSGMLDISQVCDENGQPLVWHAFCRGKSRAQLISSPSLFRASTSGAYRSFVGRANRYHHWQDILRLKTDGMETYGLGSWYEGTDQGKLNLNTFKANFGGELSQRFECKRALTTLGWLALRAERLLRGSSNGHAKRFLGYATAGRIVLETFL